MNHLLLPWIWPSFLASSGVPSTGSGQAPPATYRSGTPRHQHPAIARWHSHLRALATAIHEISGLENRFEIDYDKTKTVNTVLFSLNEVCILIMSAAMSMTRMAEEC